MDVYLTIAAQQRVFMSIELDRASLIVNRSSLEFARTRNKLEFHRYEPSSTSKMNVRVDDQSPTLIFASGKDPLAQQTTVSVNGNARSFGTIRLGEMFRDLLRNEPFWGGHVGANQALYQYNGFRFQPALADVWWQSPNRAFAICENAPSHEFSGEPRLAVLVELSIAPLRLTFLRPLVAPTDNSTSGHNIIQRLILTNDACYVIDGELLRKLFPRDASVPTEVAVRGQIHGVVDNRWVISSVANSTEQGFTTLITDLQSGKFKALTNLPNADQPVRGTVDARSKYFLIAKIEHRQVRCFAINAETGNASSVKSDQTFLNGNLGVSVSGFKLEIVSLETGRVLRVVDTVPPPTKLRQTS